MNFSTYQTIVFLWIAFGAIIFLILMKVTAPYGRYASAGWGLLMSNRAGWILMEVPAMVILMFFMIKSSEKQNVFTWTLAAFFIFHYLNRTFVFPFRIHTRGKKMPVLIMVSGFLFNLVNGFLLGYFFSSFALYTPGDLVSLRFIAGLILFMSGIYINWRYDNKLIHLRSPGSTEYRIPVGGLFEYISCPNFFGEIIEWAGYALMCWNLPALAFFEWTIANLVPRALAHHKWYKNRFRNYPVQRKAVFPWIL